MARPRRQSSSSSLTPGQAQWVLDRLLRDRKVSAGEIKEYLSAMQREISDLELQLARLRGAAGPAAAAAVAGIAAGVAGAALARRRPGRPPGRPAAAAAEKAAPGRKRGRKARKAITPEQAASRQLQGRYLALVRRFPKKQRAGFAVIAREKGREAAIKTMQDQLKK